MNCPYCDAVEQKRFSWNNRIWWTCGTYGIAGDPKKGHRSDHCCLRDELRNVKEELKKFVECSKRIMESKCGMESYDHLLDLKNLINEYEQNETN